MGMGDIEKVSGVDHSSGGIGGTPVVGKELFVRSGAWVCLRALKAHVLAEVGNARDISGI